MKKPSLLPELNIAFFSFILNFVWEILQTPFYIDKSEEINTIIWYRLHCTFGDVFITLGCFWLVSLIYRSRTWFFEPKKRRILLFIALGVIYTTFSEIMNVRIVDSWGYSELMPIIPYIKVGIVPLLQWIVVPFGLIFIVKKQLS